MNTDVRDPGSSPEASDNREMKIRQTLKARAKELAEDVHAEAGREKGIEIVEFSLAYERYGVESCFVREVFPMKELTTLPCTPDFILGIINVRGQVMSVMDIRRFFDLPVKGLTDMNRVVIVQSDRMAMGILADRILGVYTIPLEAIQLSLPTLTGIRSEYLRGITNERIVILDVNKMMSHKGFLVNEEVE